MLQKTHSAAGLVAAECVLMYYHMPVFSWESAAGLMIGCIAGPLADVDKKGSTMAKVLFPLSAVLRVLKVKHRTMTHSLLFMAAMFALSISLPEPLFWCFMLAYASHPLIDLLNEQGVELLWPLPIKFRLLPKFLAVDTGSEMETAIRYLLSILSVVLPVRYYLHM
ncbi:metal-dependent hydrolase [Paenibacillus mucilaginosus]|uniref:Membrane-bound metal-dependent hydrolase n=3 Tax=Paenibacillus mucilaginosus TaxID=61624 RepID=H6NKG4_9BACL|nr:metal-dependent hydrolase [Paenibacillus mucilaginosus]AEI44556.1 membrane-bound metal-dependent hydrolase [Paenibacillus mucilaginosus KNP414]AFC32355.1 membrane-bound metal-dependent hydrolase [Paenibacillus mucilaginosus 3016]AFH64663.1 hydrolase [Paenibacillus mucilaginosus K02]MCG7218110.1 metal-dependent hydrolase [Paenibacillus mucilaginosus]WDM26135.1 metal-dependent hydrolase [Paenibacillus mucilaginosus]